MPKAPENMTYAELAKLRAKVDQLILNKRSEAKSGLREKMAKLAEAEGMSLDDVLDGRRSRRVKGKGSVPVKYRDSNGNTWTGRGRMPLWLVAATKGGKAKKEHFLI